MPGDARDLINHLDRWEEESEARKDETPLVDAEINTRFLRGQQFPSSEGPISPYRPESAQYRFTMNIINQTLKRQVSLLTDSRPQIDVIPRRKNRRDTAQFYKTITAAIWDQQNFEQLSSRELVRAGTVGSTICVPMWDETAGHGKGNIVFPMYDPRQFKMSPNVVHAVDAQRLAEYQMIREVVPLNLVRERYPRHGWDVQASVRWSRYGRRKTLSSGGQYRGIATAMQRPWKRRDDDSVDSMSPNSELRHTWFKDFARDEHGAPIKGKPRHVRYVVDAEGVVLKDEPLRYLHGELPAHMFDWDIEFEHPYGIPMVSGVRRLQYTLNRIVGQVMENVILTNRVKVVADTNAVDPITWNAITANPNGIYIRKRQGQQFSYELPTNVVPAYVIQVIELLIRSIDLVTGMSESGPGKMPKGQNVSGVAIDALQIQAQSVIRLIARAYENWLERIFQQVLALVWQYYTEDRLLHWIGPGQQLTEFAFERARFVQDDTHTRMPDEAWQDFEFRVIPGSSLAMTRIQKGVMALNLYQAGLIPGVDVLKAAEWANPEETYGLAQKEHQQGLGPGQRTSRKMMKMPSGPSRRQQVGV